MRLLIAGGSGVSAGLGRQLGSDPALGVEKGADQSPLSILDIVFLPDKAFQPWRWEGFQTGFTNKETEVYGCTAMRSNTGT